MKTYMVTYTMRLPSGDHTMRQMLEARNEKDAEKKTEKFARDYLRRPVYNVTAERIK